MTADLFTERLARVRQRFVTTLESKIEDTFDEVPRLSGSGAEVPGQIEQTYRRIHGIVGIGPTVGFGATGRAAKAVENVLLGPHRAARALVNEEIKALMKALHGLRQVAQQELQDSFRNWR